MKIYLVNGSPREKKSISERILNHLQEKIGDAHEITRLNYGELAEKSMKSCDSVVFAFPLYVDGVPSNLLEVLKKLENSSVSLKPGIKVYAVINNGFYEPEQNKYAAGIIKIWCRHMNIEYGRTLCFGAGPMLMSVPIGRGPFKKAGLALDALADCISEGYSGDDIYTKPDFPRFMYIMSGNMNWTRTGKKYGFSKKDLKHPLIP